MSFLCKLFFWTLKDTIYIKDEDIGAYKFHDKNENIASEQRCYLEIKENFVKSRGGEWTPKNKRPEKIRDSLKELEELLNTDNCVAIQWLASGLHAFLKSGVLVTIQCKTLNDHLNIAKITFDKYLVGKLASEHVTDVFREDHYMIVVYGEPKMTYIFLSKYYKGKKMDKLSHLEPKILNADLIGPVGRRLDRRLSINSTKDWVLIWWSTRNGEIWPWMPVASDKERANLVVYGLGDSFLELISFSKTEGELVSAKFSQLNPSQILTVEERVSKLENISVNICFYQVSRGRFTRTSLTSIPLQARVVCSQWSPNEERLLLACSDMSIILYDAVKQVTRLTSSLFVPIEVAWHPGGAIVAVASEKGHVQCYDIGLSCVKMQLIGEDFQPSKKLELSAYFQTQPAVFRLIWEGNDSRSNTLCIVFENGPISTLSFTFGLFSNGTLTALELVAQHLKSNSVDEAISILHNTHWSTNPDISFKILNNIFNFLMKKPLNHDREAQLEATLGSFYDTSHPLPELVIQEYRDKVGCLARRFFHSLLRHQRFEKAFLLAVDLRCKDLFLDLHNVANVKGEKTLADVALSKATEMDSHDIMSPSTSCESETTEEDYSELSEEDLAEQGMSSYKPNEPGPLNPVMIDPLIQSPVSPGLNVFKAINSDASVRPKVPSLPLEATSPNTSTFPQVPLYQPKSFQLHPWPSPTPYNQESTLNRGLEIELPPPLAPPPLIPRLSQMKIVAPSLPPRRVISAPTTPIYSNLDNYQKFSITNENEQSKSLLGATPKTDSAPKVPTSDVLPKALEDEDEIWF